MAYSETEAIVLKKFRYGDTSLIATLFTKDFGKFNTVIKGARSLKSKYRGIFETTNHIKIIFNKKENRELQTISKSELLNSFPKIKNEIEKLLISFRLVELVNKLFYQYDKNENTFILLKDTLNSLANFSKEPSIILLYFQVKIAKNIGIHFVDKEDKENLIKDETFSTVHTLKLDRNEFFYIQNLYNQEFKSLNKFQITTNLLYKLIDFMDVHLLSNYYSIHSLPSKRSIFQMENFKINK